MGIEKWWEAYGNGHLEPWYRHDWAGKRVAVDASILMWKAHTGLARAAIVALLDNGYDGAKEVNVLRKIVAMRDVGAEVICVFDGNPTRWKAAVAGGKRQQERDKAYHKLFEELAKGRPLEEPALLATAKNATRPSPDSFAKLRALLHEEGFAYVQAPFEADICLAQLGKAGLVDLIVTNDSDVAVRGGTPVLKTWSLNTMVGQVLMRRPPLPRALWPYLEHGDDDVNAEIGWYMLGVYMGCDYGPRRGTTAAALAAVVHLMQRSGLRIAGAPDVAYPFLQVVQSMAMAVSMTRPAESHPEYALLDSIGGS